MMPEHINTSRYCAVVAVVLLLFIFWINPAYAGSQAFSGFTTTITPDKSCSDKPNNHEMTLVFDGEPESATSGWFFGKGTSAAEFKRISPTRFEVTYAVTRYNKLPLSSMELLPSMDGFNVVVQDHIPENKEIRESLCFFETLKAIILPLSGVDADLKTRAKELFAADLIMLESENLLYKQKEYNAAIAQANKALPFYVSNFGQWSKESLNTTTLIVFAMMYQERFDEALEIITPYRKALPDHALLKEFEEMIIKVKKEQDDLFRSDPDSKSDVDLGPLG